MSEWLAVNFEVLDVFVKGLACLMNSCPAVARELVGQIVTAVLFEGDFGENIAFAVGSKIGQYYWCRQRQRHPFPYHLPHPCPAQAVAAVTGYRFSPEGAVEHCALHPVNLRFVSH